MKRKIWMTAANRARLNGLPDDVSRKIDDAILDLADGIIAGIELPSIGAFCLIDEYGDRIVYDIDAKNLFIVGFSIPEE